MNGMFELNFIETGLKTMAMLFIVIALLILFLWFIKRFFLSRRGVKENLFIKVLSSLYLSPKERLEVIEISGEKIVLGVTPGSITFITKLNDLNMDNGNINGKSKDHEIET